MLAECDKDDLQRPNDLSIPLRFLVPILAVTQDFRPIYWLIEKFLEDQGEKRKRALDDLAELLPQIQAALSLVNQSGDENDAKLRAVE